MEGSAPSGVEDLEPTSPADLEPTSPAESGKPQEEAEEEEQVVENSSSGDDAPSMEMVQTFYEYPANWEAAGLSSPEQAEDDDEKVEAKSELKEEDTTQAAEDIAEELEPTGGDSDDSAQVDLFFHQMEMAMNESVESTGHESTSAGVSVEHGTGASSSNTGSVYDLPDTQWSDEDWEIWADVLRCSGKNKGQKRRLEMFRRFKYLRQQGQWVGTTPNDHAKSARMSACPKSSGGKPE